MKTSFSSSSSSSSSLPYQSRSRARGSVAFGHHLSLSVSYYLVVCVSVSLLIISAFLHCITFCEGSSMRSNTRVVAASRNVYRASRSVTGGAVSGFLFTPIPTSSSSSAFGISLLRWKHSMPKNSKTTLYGKDNKKSSKLKATSTDNKEVLKMKSDGQDGPKTKDFYNMDEIVNLCKRRGFVYPSADIYNGFNGFYDYGPMGAELKNNIKQRWWRDMVHGREDIVGLDASIISSPRIWEASGHVAGFVDPMVDCKESKLRYRADQLFFCKVSIKENDETIGYLSILESGSMKEEAEQLAEKMKRKGGHQGTLVVSELKDMTKATEEELTQIPSPATGTPGTLTPPRNFNLMFSTSVGAQQDSSSTAYLRPETAQGIFTNFKNVQSTSRVKIPFGIAQIGKAFRNEITPRNFIFRSREFEQMEIEYFIKPGDEEWMTNHQNWIKDSWNWLLSIGLREDLMDKDVHPDSDLAHYAKACTDIVFNFPFGKVELQGIAARGNFDLSQHAEFSGKSMEYFDESDKTKYVPHVIEPSIGVDRLFLALICSAYDEDEIGGEKRTLLRFHPTIAPIKIGIFPLMKNKPEIVAKAREIYEKLSRRYNVFYDATGAVGRRYRRMDEAGTPFCLTVDFDTLEDNTVTIRDRDSTEQIRMPIDDIYSYFSKQIDGI